MLDHLPLVEGGRVAAGCYYTARPGSLAAVGWPAQLVGWRMSLPGGAPGISQVPPFTCPRPHHVQSAGGCSQGVNFPCVCGRVVWASPFVVSRSQDLHRSIHELPSVFPKASQVGHFLVANPPLVWPGWCRQGRASACGHVVFKLLLYYSLNKFPRLFSS